MIWLAPLTLAPLMLVQAGVPAQPADDVEDQIIVLAERLRTISVSVGQDAEGQWHCSLSASSGNGRVDDGLCRAATRCNQKHGGDQEKVGNCMRERHARMLEDFRERLREAE